MTIQNIELEILAFGIMRDIVGGATFQHQLQTGATVADLQQQLEKKHPAIKELRSFLVAVNNEYGDPDLVIKVGDEVALIPPVSGG